MKAVARIPGRAIHVHASASAIFRFFGVHPSKRDDIDAPAKYYVHLSRAELEWHLSDARKNYLSMLRKAHPDKGGTNAEAAALNVAWDQLLKRVRYLHPDIEI